jgi:fucose permease
VVVAFAIVAVEWCVGFWLASYLDDGVGLPRRLAVALTGAFAGAMLVGRLLSSALSRRIAVDRQLLASLALELPGIVLLLTAHSAAWAGVAIAVLGLGLGPTFPLTCAWHVGASPGGSTAALAQIFVAASIGQILGPLTTGAIAQLSSLRAGLLVVPALILLAGLTVARQRFRSSARGG